MKRALALAVLIAGSRLDASEIVQKPLDEFVIYNIPIACQSGNTTILFPSAISGLYGKSVAVQEQANADFVLSFTPGNFYFAVRALKKDAEDHLTVIYNKKAYILQLSASEKPFYSVTFFQGGNTRAAARPLVPERLLSLLDKAKAYRFSRRTTQTVWLESSIPLPTPRTTTIISTWSLATCGGSRRRTLSSSASTSKTRRTARSITSPRTLRSGSKTGFTHSPLPTRQA
jgi:hypothetical protein